MKKKYFFKLIKIKYSFIFITLFITLFLNQNLYSQCANYGKLPSQDYDCDGVINKLDYDDDNDGILDSIESGCPLNDPNLVSNGNFQTLPTGTFPKAPGSNLGGWTATINCVSNSTYPNDTSLSVQTGNLNYVGIIQQVTFPGDPANDEPANNRCLYANGNNTGGSYVAWKQTITVTPNSTYRFVFYTSNAIKPNYDAPDDAIIQIKVNGINIGSTIRIYDDVDPLSGHGGIDKWDRRQVLFTTGAGQTTALLEIQDNQLNLNGDDWVITNISVRKTCNPYDSDLDGIQDYLDLDSDNDGIGDIIEDGWITMSNGKDTMDLTSSNWIDTNGNGWNNTAESFYNSGGNPKNFDGDLVPNYLDLDSDNDAIFDVDEAGLSNGDGDVNCDGVGDGTDVDTDGILSKFDNLNTFGNSSISLPANTLGATNPDYLNPFSKSLAYSDISTTLYANLDANNNGIIDGNADIDRDGIIDAFDTKTNALGSPRDLNRKLFLDFDGRNDYGQENVQILDNLTSGTLMAWIDLNNNFSSDGVVIGQNKFQLRITAGKKLEAYVNTTTLTYSTQSLNTSQWYHIGVVYGGGLIKLFLNGTLVASKAASGNIVSDGSKLTIGRDPSSNSNFFKGKIDEIRIFNTNLTDLQLQRMVYQEIQNSSSNVRGVIIPYDIGSLPFSSLLRYYKMDVYKNDIIDDLTTTPTDLTGMKIFNHKIIKIQEAPMPFVTLRTGNFATAVDDTTKDIRGLDVIEHDASIIHVRNNISETSNETNLGMMIDPSVTVTMNNDTKIQNDWYLLLNGKIDLQGKSQLIQTTNSILDVASAGSIERDQIGTKNIFNYNYWSSPVGIINNTTNNNSYTVAGVMKDGTTNTPQNITWTTGLNGSPTNPITLSNYWIFKFQNLSNSYANWVSVGSNGTLNAAQGFTLKGSGTSASNQNYTFVGKPNNGLITTSIAANNLNLTGNPYASALDSSAFITNNNTSITGALYFWEHSSTNNSHILLAYQGGYSVRNLVGGTPPTAPADINGVGQSTKVPQRYIPVGQGFFIVGSGTGGTVTFNNNQRLFIKEENASSNFLIKNSVLVNANPFINNAEDETSEDSFKRIRLGITSNNYQSQILLGFMNQLATSAIDYGYDAVDIDNQSNDIYFINNGTKLVIQGDGNFDVNNTYPIGIKTSLTGDVKIMLDNTENFTNSDNLRVFIHDNSDNQYHEITNNPYIVELPEGITDNRFTLTFKDNSTVLANSSVNNEHGIEVAYANTKHILNIKNNFADAKVEQVLLYNIIGQLVTSFEVKNQSQQNIQLPIHCNSSGIYNIKVKTNKGITSKKIVFN